MFTTVTSTIVALVASVVDLFPVMSTYWYASHTLQPTLLQQPPEQDQQQQQLQLQLETVEEQEHLGRRQLCRDFASVLADFRALDSALSSLIEISRQFRLLRDHHGDAKQHEQARERLLRRFDEISGTACACFSSKYLSSLLEQLETIASRCLADDAHLARCKKALSSDECMQRLDIHSLAKIADEYNIAPARNMAERLGVLYRSPAALIAEERRVRLTLAGEQRREFFDLTSIAIESACIPDRDHMLALEEHRRRCESYEKMMSYTLREVKKMLQSMTSKYPHVVMFMIQEALLHSDRIKPRIISDALRSQRQVVHRRLAQAERAFDVSVLQLSVATQRLCRLLKKLHRAAEATTNNNNYNNTNLQSTSSSSAASPCLHDAGAKLKKSRKHNNNNTKSNTRLQKLDSSSPSPCTTSNNKRLRRRHPQQQQSTQSRGLEKIHLIECTACSQQLPGSQFTSSQQHRRDRRCKTCVQAQRASLVCKPARIAVAAVVADRPSSPAAVEEQIKCAACDVAKPRSSFSRRQLRRRSPRCRCNDCVEHNQPRLDRLARHMQEQQRVYEKQVEQLQTQYRVAVEQWFERSVALVHRKQQQPKRHRTTRQTMKQQLQEQQQLYEKEMLRHQAQHRVAVENSFTLSVQALEQQPQQQQQHQRQAASVTVHTRRSRLRESLGDLKCSACRFMSADFSNHQALDVPEDERRCRICIVKCPVPLSVVRNTLLNTWLDAWASQHNQIHRDADREWTAIMHDESWYRSALLHLRRFRRHVSASGSPAQQQSSHIDEEKQQQQFSSPSPTNEAVHCISCDVVKSRDCFGKRQLRRHPLRPAHCKECTQKQHPQQPSHQQAESQQQQQQAIVLSEPPTLLRSEDTTTSRICAFRVCSACKHTRPRVHFSNTQLNRSDSRVRCMQCTGNDPLLAPPSDVTVASLSSADQLAYSAEYNRTPTEPRRCESCCCRTDTFAPLRQTVLCSRCAAAKPDAPQQRDSKPSSTQQRERPIDALRQKQPQRQHSSSSASQPTQQQSPQLQQRPARQPASVGTLRCDSCNTTKSRDCFTNSQLYRHRHGCTARCKACVYVPPGNNKRHRRQRHQQQQQPITAPLPLSQQATRSQSAFICTVCRLRLRSDQLSSSQRRKWQCPDNRKCTKCVEDARASRAAEATSNDSSNKIVVKPRRLNKEQRAKLKREQHRLKQHQPKQEQQQHTERPPRPTAAVGVSCCACKQLLSRSAFSTSQRRRSEPHCKSCVSARLTALQQHQQQQQQQQPASVENLECHACHLTKPRDCFSVSQLCHYRDAARCKGCVQQAAASSSSSATATTVVESAASVAVASSESSSSPSSPLLHCIKCRSDKSVADFTVSMRKPRRTRRVCTSCVIAAEQRDLALIGEWARQHKLLQQQRDSKGKLEQHDSHSASSQSSPPVDTSSPAAPSSSSSSPSSSACACSSSSSSSCPSASPASSSPRQSSSSATGLPPDGKQQRRLKLALAARSKAATASAPAVPAFEDDPETTAAINSIHSFAEKHRLYKFLPESWRVERGSAATNVAAIVNHYLIEFEAEREAGELPATEHQTTLAGQLNRYIRTLHQLRRRIRPDAAFTDLPPHPPSRFLFAALSRRSRALRRSLRAAMKSRGDSDPFVFPSSLCRQTSAASHLSSAHWEPNPALYAPLQRSWMQSYCMALARVRLLRSGDIELNPGPPKQAVAPSAQAPVQLRCVTDEHEKEAVEIICDLLYYDIGPRIERRNNNRNRELAKDKDQDIAAGKPPRDTPPLPDTLRTVLQHGVDKSLLIQSLKNHVHKNKVRLEELIRFSERGNVRGCGITIATVTRPAKKKKGAAGVDDVFFEQTLVRCLPTQFRTIAEHRTPGSPRDAPSSTAGARIFHQFRRKEDQILRDRAQQRLPASQLRLQHIYSVRDRLVAAGLPAARIAKWIAEMERNTTMDDPTPPRFVTYNVDSLPASDENAIPNLKCLDDLFKRNLGLNLDSDGTWGTLLAFLYAVQPEVVFLQEVGVNATLQNKLQDNLTKCINLFKLFGYDSLLYCDPALANGSNDSNKGLGVGVLVRQHDHYVTTLSRVDLALPANMHPHSVEALIVDIKRDRKQGLTDIDLPTLRVASFYTAGWKSPHPLRQLRATDMTLSGNNESEADASVIAERYQHLLGEQDDDDNPGLGCLVIGGDANMWLDEMTATNDVCKQGLRAGKVIEKLQNEYQHVFPDTNTTSAHIVDGFFLGNAIRDETTAFCLDVRQPTPKEVTGGKREYMGLHKAVLSDIKLPKRFDNFFQACAVKSRGRVEGKYNHHVPIHRPKPGSDKEKQFIQQIQQFGADVFADRRNRRFRMKLHSLADWLINGMHKVVNMCDCVGRGKIKPKQKKTNNADGTHQQQDHDSDSDSSSSDDDDFDLDLDDPVAAATTTTAAASSTAPDGASAPAAATKPKQPVSEITPLELEHINSSIKAEQPAKGVPFIRLTDGTGELIYKPHLQAPLLAHDYLRQSDPDIAEPLPLPHYTLEQRPPNTHNRVQRQRPSNDARHPFQRQSPLDITEQTMIDVTRTIKNGGMDGRGIYAWLLKLFVTHCSEFRHVYTVLARRIFEERRWSQSLKHDIVVPTAKKDKEDPFFIGNIRYIMPSLNLAKPIELLFVDQAAKLLNFHPDVYSFLPGNSCTLPLVKLVTQIADGMRCETSTNRFMTLMTKFDIVKAYPRLLHERVLRAFDRCRRSDSLPTDKRKQYDDKCDQLQEMLASWMSGRVFQVRPSLDHLSDKFKSHSTRGVPAGSVMSGLCLALVMSSILFQFENTTEWHKAGAACGPQRIKMPVDRGVHPWCSAGVYADDGYLALTGGDFGVLRQQTTILLSKLRSICAEHGLEMTASVHLFAQIHGHDSAATTRTKRPTMWQRISAPDKIITLDGGQRINVTIEPFKYLGVTFDNNLCFKFHVDNIVAAARAKIAALRHRFRKKQSFVACRSQYLTRVLAGIRYAAAAWWPILQGETGLKGFGDGIASLETTHNIGTRAVLSLLRECDAELAKMHIFCDTPCIKHMLDEVCFNFYQSLIRRPYSCPVRRRVQLPPSYRNAGVQSSFVYTLREYRDPSVKPQGLSSSLSEAGKVFWNSPDGPGHYCDFCVEFRGVKDVHKYCLSAGVRNSKDEMAHPAWFTLPNIRDEADAYDEAARAECDGEAQLRLLSRYFSNFNGNKYSVSFSPDDVRKAKKIVSPLIEKRRNEVQLTREQLHKLEDNKAICTKFIELCAARALSKGCRRIIVVDGCHSAQHGSGCSVFCYSVWWNNAVRWGLPSRHSFSLGSNQDSYSAEVYALCAALRQLVLDARRGQPVAIFSDCQSALQVLSSEWRPLRDMKDETAMLLDHRDLALSIGSVHFFQIPSHVGWEQHDDADAEAKRAASLGANDIGSWIEDWYRGGERLPVPPSSKCEIGNREPRDPVHRAAKEAWLVEERRRREEAEEAARRRALAAQAAAAPAQAQGIADFQQHQLLRVDSSGRVGEPEMLVDDSSGRVGEPEMLVDDSSGRVGEPEILFDSAAPKRRHCNAQPICAQAPSTASSRARQQLRRNLLLDVNHPRHDLLSAGRVLQDARAHRQVEESFVAQRRRLAPPISGELQPLLPVSRYGLIDYDCDLGTLNMRRMKKTIRNHLHTHTAVEQWRIKAINNINEKRKLDIPPGYDPRLWKMVIKSLYRYSIAHFFRLLTLAHWVIGGHLHGRDRPCPFCKRPLQFVNERNCKDPNVESPLMHFRSCNEWQQWAQGNAVIQQQQQRLQEKFNFDLSSAGIGNLFFTQADVARFLERWKQKSFLMAVVIAYSKMLIEMDKKINADLAQEKAAAAAAAGGGGGGADSDAGGGGNNQGGGDDRDGGSSRACIGDDDYIMRQVSQVCGVGDLNTDLLQRVRRLFTTRNPDLEPTKQDLIDLWTDLISGDDDGADDNDDEFDGLWW